jgi:hypothetical protein
VSRPAYFVFVYSNTEKCPPKGGLHDLVSTEDTLEKARRAVEQCAAASRGYHIAVTDPDTGRLAIVERGGFKAEPRRTPTEVQSDPHKVRLDVV